MGKRGPKPGYKPSEETKQKISAALIGREFSEERKATASASAKLCQNRPEVSARKSEIVTQYHLDHPDYQTGENSPCWIEDRTRLDSEGYPAELRDIDDFIREELGTNCEECGKSEEENGRRLSRHHLDEDKTNSDLDNFRLLCISCHARLHEQLKRQARQE